MNLNRFTISLLLALLVSLPRCAWAFYLPDSQPLPQSIAQAQLIVVARLKTFVPNSKDAVAKKPRDAVISISGPEGWIAASTLKPSGDYTFEVLQTLKSKCEPVLHLTLPPIVAIAYRGKIQVEPGVIALLMLRQDAKKQWVAVDLNMPLIPLSNAVGNLKLNESAESVQSRVVTALCASLADTQLRRLVTHLLHQGKIVDPQIPPALLPYENDADAEVGDSVLYCLLTNQQIDAIPRVAQLATKVWQRGRGESSRSIMGLENLKSREALPYLNRLLFEPSPWTRMGAMFAVVKLADRSSIPYLMLALRDPESQNYVSFSAYGKLHRLLPNVGHPKSWSYFEIQREAETRRLHDWWSDELNGEHLKDLKPEDVPQLPTKIPDAIAELHPLLFLPYPSVRQLAMAKMEKAADRTSIPYLVLALQDPDATVAYGAYATLRRLLPTTGATKDKEEFSAHREMASQPLYDWWDDELSGRHLPLPKTAP